MFSGMRRGEILGLRKSAIDFDAKLIALTETKTNKARYIPIHDSLVEILRRACDRSTSDYVFATKEGVPSPIMSPPCSVRP